jgi:Bacterial regulatory helix-turn-helix protein, lysR family
LAAHRDAWFGVEPRHLAALVGIGEARSFRGAADNLGHVQSAVSRQISLLERLEARHTFGQLKVPPVAAA